MSSCTSKQLLDLLDSQPWDDIIPRLVAHASKKSKRLFWRGIYGGPFPEGNEVMDLINQTIEKVLVGQRQWDPDASPDLFVYLKSIVDSDLNHLADSAENRRMRADTLSSQGNDCDAGEQEISIAHMMPADTPTPEEVLLLREDEDRCEEFFWGFYESLADKPVLQKIVECIWDDVEKPVEIAERMGVPVNEIYNSRKQLQRRLNDYRKSQ